MCLITYLPPGVMPVRQELENGIEVNPEGAGYALIAPDGGMLTDKSLYSEPILRSFMSLRVKYPDGPAVFHSRLSTGSGVSLANTHPFEVGGDPETLFFFNGAELPGVTENGDGRADARIFAEDQLPRIMPMLDKLSFDGATSWSEILDATRFVSVNTKAVILTSNPSYQEQAYVYNRGQWILTPEGALHSQPDFLGKDAGWTEATEMGDLYRWNLPQDGQCTRCHQFGHAREDCENQLAVRPFRWRNETERRRNVEALS